MGDKGEYHATGDMTIAVDMARAGGKIHRIHLNGTAVAGNMGLQLQASDPNASALGTIFAVGYETCNP